MRRVVALLWAVYLAVGAAMPAAAAGLTVYTSKATFLAAIHAVAVDTFDDLSTTEELPDAITRTVDDYGYTVRSVPQDPLYRAGSPTNGSLSTYNVGDWLHFGDFTGGVNAVGLDLFNTTADGSTAPLTHLTLYALSLRDEFAFVDWDSFQLRSEDIAFLGFTWDRTKIASELAPTMPLIYLKFGEGGLYDSFPTVDNLILGVANGAAVSVPEPASWAMLVLGFGGAGLAMREARRRKLGFA